ncbi:MAG: two-component system, OmpR family, catabolic regulation response regulator CreB [Chthoniobacter sp.]|jgi:two-component system catabolic regulation response regulator CreB|nr:two-component system, OmpR family, catabolic regulation response regulator CreB [Chthoniobacter sp.]
MPPRILLVEDEPSIADNIIYALKTDGFEPVWCATGRDALARFGQEKFTLIILDVGLPDMNGFELCKQIRAASPVPIVFVTARKDEIDRVVGLEIGADDYVVKPFSPRELTARVKAILRRTEHAAPALGPAPVFAIDEERCEVRYHGTALVLSRYEFRLLKILAQKPGRVFSREQLMEQAWEEPETAFDRTVDAHVKTLRAKLRAVRSDEDPIRTHRGMGYSMKELP